MSLASPDAHLRPRTEIGGIRDRYLSRASDDLTGVRPVVARSWHRSRAAGVDAMADQGVVSHGRVDEMTVTSAASYLTALDEFASDIGGYVSLTAPNGSLVQTDFLRGDDEFPVGYSLLEESCGSTGEGVALEEGRGVWLAPEEHFREDMRSNWCFATLIRDPFHSRVRAVVGLTIPVAGVSEPDPASVLLMLEGVAARIERDIESRTSSKERALLHEYLRISRRRGGSPVVALDGKNSLMNAHATSSLADSDWPLIFGFAKDVMASGRGVQSEVSLTGVGFATLDVSPVGHLDGNAGAIVVVKPHAVRRQRHDADVRSTVIAPDRGEDSPIVGFEGSSAELRRTMAGARVAIEQGVSAAIYGEEGAGKRRLACAITAAWGGDTTIIDVRTRSGADMDSFGDLRGAVALVHADELSATEAHRLSGELEGRSDVRLAFTAKRATEATQILTEAMEAVEITVAPLRARRDDIPALAAAIAAERGDTRLSRNLITTLTNFDWPKNVEQLRRVVTHALERAHGNEATVDDLPYGFQAVQSNGRLSRLEDAELVELRSALREADGNRRLAAEMLEIGRSTLYRRMDYFRSRGFDL